MGKIIQLLYDLIVYVCREDDRKRDIFLKKLQEIKYEDKA